MQSRVFSYFKVLMLAFLLVLKSVFIKAGIYEGCEMTVIEKLDVIIIFGYPLLCSGVFDLNVQTVFLRVIMIIVLPGAGIYLSVFIGVLGPAGPFKGKRAFKVA